MYCDQCGTLVQATAKFCHKCGHRLQGVAGEPAPEKQQETPTPEVIPADEPVESCNVQQIKPESGQGAEPLEKASSIPENDSRNRGIDPDIEWSVRETETEELVERLKSGYYREEARPIVERELQNRELHPDSPEPSDPPEPVSDFSLSDLPFWRQLFTFKGRTGRLKFWLVVPPAWVFFILCRVYLEILLNRGESTVGLFVLLIPVAWVHWATIAQRCHDRGKSGIGYYLLLLIPFIGQLWAIFELGFLPGMPGSNRYGKSILEIVYE
ncbi:MAG: DUF805 domain-containing protein [Candidatus Accumulibacter sp.]|jgi:uncharacterized membrane protein YhaH (DUF805 family)|nr:DUF805 domain-containing protein [Accumulibacter sp.]